ncbi:hypothetical protein M011DRAFT_456821 [Sporormia fimetaria CBS 119925]|uniref:Uncharacterized protein n=1 Tax=Sporormia fimetaria CBS 119925 TaxID=1340428 RepID=A0A6A6VFG1_9PLEO|nr:hypothetical protein M011DRAFT_456821 [Sporormia fimetaria CBS 119925]
MYCRMKPSEACTRGTPSVWFESQIRDKRCCRIVCTWQPPSLVPVQGAEQLGRHAKGVCIFINERSTLKWPPAARIGGSERATRSSTSTNISHGGTRFPRCCECPRFHHQLHLQALQVILLTCCLGVTLWTRCAYQVWSASKVDAVAIQLNPSSVAREIVVKVLLVCVQVKLPGREALLPKERMVVVLCWPAVAQCQRKARDGQHDAAAGGYEIRNGFPSARIRPALSPLNGKLPFAAMVKAAPLPSPLSFAIGGGVFGVVLFWLKARGSHSETSEDVTLGYPPDPQPSCLLLHSKESSLSSGMQGALRLCKSSRRAEISGTSRNGASEPQALVFEMRDLTLSGVVVERGGVLCRRQEQEPHCAVKKSHQVTRAPPRHPMDRRHIPFTHNRHLAIALDQDTISSASTYRALSPTMNASSGTARISPDVPLLRTLPTGLLRGQPLQPKNRQETA